MQPYTTFTSAVVYLPQENIDTDQIIPARYMKTIDKKGLGDHLFHDWRYNQDGSPKPDFALNLPSNQGRKILVAGHNFGPGSSREHAPWALTGWGFKAVISTLFADILRNNSLKNGLLTIQVDSEGYSSIVQLLKEHPDARLTIDLENQAVVLPDGQKITFPIDAFSKMCLVRGIDQLGYLLSHMPQIQAYESARAGSG